MYYSYSAATIGYLIRLDQVESNLIQESLATAGISCVLESQCSVVHFKKRDRLEL